MPSDTGKFSTEIADALIAAAVESVEKHREAASGEPLSVDPETVPRADEAPDAGDATAGLPDPTGPVAALRARIAELELAQAALQSDASALRARVAELETAAKDAHERALRAAADLDNGRKRAAREREDIQRFGLERMLKDVLPVVDNLDRALDMGAKTGAWAQLADGVRMTRKLLEDTLARSGMTAFSAVGQPFDPHLHEAMGQEPRADVPPGTVSTEVLRGFRLHDRLVRPALVMVAKAPAPAENGPDAPASAAIAESGPAAVAAVPRTSPALRSDGGASPDATVSPDPVAGPLDEHREDGEGQG